MYTKRPVVSVCWPEVSAKSCGCFAELVAAMVADSSLGQVLGGKVAALERRCACGWRIPNFRQLHTAYVCVLAKWRILTMCVEQCAFEGYTRPSIRPQTASEHETLSAGWHDMEKQR